MSDEITVTMLQWRVLRRIAAGYEHGTHRSAVVRAQVDKWMDDVIRWNLMAVGAEEGDENGDPR